MPNDGGSAFPLPFHQDLDGMQTFAYQADTHGMSLRDYFAAKVLDHASHDLTEPRDIAKRAYAIADAMIAERNT